jgi:hypothetical protein
MHVITWNNFSRLEPLVDDAVHVIYPALIRVCEMNSRSGDMY